MDRPMKVVPDNLFHNEHMQVFLKRDYLKMHIHTSNSILQSTGTSTCTDYRHL